MILRTKERAVTAFRQSAGRARSRSLAHSGVRNEDFLARRGPNHNVKSFYLDDRLTENLYLVVRFLAALAVFRGGPGLSPLKAGAVSFQSPTSPIETRCLWGSCCLKHPLGASRWPENCMWSRMAGELFKDIDGKFRPVRCGAWKSRTRTERRCFGSTSTQSRRSKAASGLSDCISRSVIRAWDEIIDADQGRLKNQNPVFPLSVPRNSNGEPRFASILERSRLASFASMFGAA
jgi:hypothetical protein